MKKSVFFSLIVVFVFALIGTAFAQTEKSAETAPSELPAQLEKIAQDLTQENVTPEQLKQMAQMLKQKPGMAERGQKMPMMPMMPDMMGAKQDPKSMGRMMQMRGEMMQAMGKIMQKYGKLMAEEAKPVEATPVASIEQSAKTATYELALKIGPPEKMLTTEEAKTAKEGEVMTSGEMAMSMPDMPLTHHLEVSVKDAKSGATVTNQAVTIAATNDATQKVANVPVATMYGLDEGVAETHFGNNVALPAGAYTIVVTVGKETATFQVTIPVDL